MKDEKYMRLALNLAEKGCGKVNPNPLVGAVIVKNSKVIGKGYHMEYGGFHAEREAISSCCECPEGADMYVTLEPCCHQGKQPPCTEAIIQAGIKHVIVGSYDPNPLVSGKGIQMLKEHGIKVTENFLREECDSVNYVFCNFISTGFPYVVMKYAMTMDGKIAVRTGESRWVTGKEARKQVHRDRNRYSAVMVGIGTVLKDDPLLTCRIAGGRNPIRIVCDTDLRIPEDSQIVKTSREIRTIIATASNDVRQYRKIQQAGCEIFHIPVKNGHIDLKKLMRKLGEINIDSVLLEGGATINWAALEADIVNKIQVYISPKLFGGGRAPSPIGGKGVSMPAAAFMASPPKITFFNDDILLESEVMKKCLQE